MRFIDIYCMAFLIIQSQFFCSNFDNSLGTQKIKLYKKTLCVSQNNYEKRFVSIKTKHFRTYQ